ncbi:hypothetical protein M422DRAFT_274100 [Sphaerobolus stellatus SS14]|uniref:Unplaced genomic scaffold SPHSTscaffold_365, whole genome shotgun sequence n=1 Tax=Sphaerobolus stellatus (strain SS14) TaxID=990650 RepID=A0A0C9UII5_SPHS4|nr:hypothetical protein M422DRAFT_274100 [Sphaerobolus stellatus SS14]
MCGRATIVLEVLEYEGYVAGNPEQAQIFVMKQSWQRLPLKNNYNINQVIALENSSLLESDISPSLPSDGDSQVRPFDNTPYEVYAHSEDSLKDRIHCSVYVKNHNSDIVDIMLTIRKGLTGYSEQAISAEKLGWEDNIDDCRPSFGDHVPGSENITLYESSNISDKAVHDAIHNIESFWWIFIHLALTREGPSKRLEARSTDLDRVVEEYFDGSVSQLTKAKTGAFYQYRGDQTTDWAPQRSAPEKLPPFFRAWHEYHNIHKRILDLLQTNIEKIPDETGELTQQEDIRRVKYHSDGGSREGAAMRGFTSDHSRTKREVGDA